MLCLLACECMASFFSLSPMALRVPPATSPAGPSSTTSRLRHRRGPQLGGKLATPPNLSLCPLAHIALLLRRYHPILMPLPLLPLPPRHHRKQPARVSRRPGWAFNGAAPPGGAPHCHESTLRPPTPSTRAFSRLWSAHHRLNHQRPLVSLMTPLTTAATRRLS